MGPTCGGAAFGKDVGVSFGGLDFSFFFFLAGPAGLHEVASESNFFSLMEKMDVNVPCNLRKSV